MFLGYVLIVSIKLYVFCYDTSVNADKYSINLVVQFLLVMLRFP